MAFLLMEIWLVAQQKDLMHIPYVETSQIEYLNCNKKCVCMGYRRYILAKHWFCSQKGPFNGRLEHCFAPKIVGVSKKENERKRIGGRVK